jgi:solute:Na+ symporter, SSS family
MGSLSFWDYVIIGAYLVLMLAVGLFYRKTGSKNIEAFFLGGRNFPWWLAGISLVATTFAADTPLAITELVNNKGGIAGNWMWWNFLAGGMLTTFFFAKLWWRADILTDLELIEIRYSGKPAAFLRGFRAVYLGIFMNSLVIGWINVALVSIPQIFFDIPREEVLWYIAIAMIITASYSAMAGLLGVAVTDFIQFFIAMGGTIALAFYVLDAPEIGGIDGLKAKLPPSALNFFPTIGNAGAVDVLDSAGIFTLSIGSFLAYVTMQWWASWYPGSDPGGGGYVAQRMMSTKNQEHAIAATLFFQIMNYCFRPWPWIIVGLCVMVLYPWLGETDKKLGYIMAMRDYLPTGLKGLLITAFLAAYMSIIAS